MTRIQLAVRSVALLLLVEAGPGGSTAALAQPANPATTPSTQAPATPQKTVEPRVTAVSPKTAAMGDRVRLTVAGLGEMLQQKKRPARDLVLYLDGRALKEARAEPVGPGGDVLEFRLQRSQASRDAWNAVLAKPSVGGRRVTVSTGFPDEREIRPAPNPLRLDLLDRFWLWVVVVFLLLVLWALARFSDLLRDPAPVVLKEGERRPYSLARTQMAFWFCVVLASYLFLLIVTHDYETLNAQTLVLLGIGAATLLAAAGVDASKRDKAKEEAAEAQTRAAEQTAYLQELKAEHAQVAQAVQARAATAEDVAMLPVLEAKLKAEQRHQEKLGQEAAASTDRRWPTNDWFLRDLLTDANGLNLHRFQMLVWTLVLGGVFLYQVYTEVTMPEFSATLLTLMGISSGVYVALKVPERQLVPWAPDPPAPPQDHPAPAPVAKDRVKMGFGRERPETPAHS